MRSRTIREGSVGLLILLGLGVFVGLVLWIRGIRWGDRSYQFIVRFTDVAGMKTGASVRYRGVDVGKIKQVKATTNGVDVTMEIDSADLAIPRDSAIEANQSGLIGETSIDITPRTPLASGAQAISPFSNQCNSQVIICHQDRLTGEIGVSFIELLRNTERLTAIYTDPAFFDNVNSLAKNASLAANGVARLTAELSLLSRSVRAQVGTFSTATNSITAVATQTAIRIGNTADRFGELATSSNQLLTRNEANLNTTLTQFNRLATSANEVVSGNRENLSTLLAQFNQLATSANELVATNRGTLQNTLTGISQTSEQLGLLVTRLNATSEQVDVGKLVGNLTTLSANAAEASANLRDISAAFNSPANLLVLQQTLDSARATFENAQKITADLDELTGDPQFRQNVKDLVNGLSKLVSSTQQLEQQIQVAQELESVRAAINTAAAQSADTASTNPPQPVANEHQLSQEEQLFKLSPPAPKKQLADAAGEDITTPGLTPKPQN
ncbi:MAG TPA: MCE family protein [Cyanobacteria bacterium UBA8803]|nr:MCE family protein [Cyanobacteria bacterium UBA9273]HBL57824.1 MCE family protein [Cyanobacteria bacterium UBA8803]